MKPSLPLCLLALALSGRGAAGGCGMAEFACKSGACVRLDQFCDAAAQCPDASDEPAGCSVCNRTYYGRAGEAYSLRLAEAPRVPFLCHLTFTAGGAAHGDLVQLGFADFRLGRYEAGALDGCPDGFMQLSELGRPFTGGSWCGAATGAALYYSETSTVTVSVKLFRARLGEPFGFSLHYKFLAQRDAVVRFGELEAPLERGAVSPGTYCTRTFEECHRRPCRLQSPNYPGIYPRNVTCYWSLRQKDIPTCKHAMLSVRQEHSHKMQIKRSIAVASLNKTERAVRAWAECTGERDRLVVYDGGSTDDPVLLEYCGGGWLPRVTARAGEMLVAFHSSPYSAVPPALDPLQPLRGFELDVDVIFADSDSLDYARESRRCEFHIKASSSSEEGNSTSRGRRGVLRAPLHTLPPNTVCTWTFHGRPGDLVWVYFSSFTHYSLVQAKRAEREEREDREEREEETAVRSTRAPGAPQPKESCAVRLRIWEGGGEAGGGEALLASLCDEAPRLCARASLANATRAPRPCAPPDGYVSRAPLLALSAATLPGTATHPLAFRLHYEFVDARLEGEPRPPPGPPARAVPAACARLLTRPGPFASPRNALLFGRGGAKRLRCSYRLQPEQGGVALTLAAASFGRRSRCSTVRDAVSGRLTCTAVVADEAPGDVEAEDDFYGTDDVPLREPHLVIYDSPWPGYRVPVACLCDNASVPLQLQSSGALELELVAGALAAAEDHRALSFSGSWAARASRDCARRRRPPGPGGHFSLVYPYEDEYDSECGSTPFLLSARGNRSAFVRVWGSELPQAPPAASAEAELCPTPNRLLLYDAHSLRLVKAICPGAAGEDGAEAPAAPSAQAFSSEWWAPAEASGALMVVWLATVPGRATWHWAEVYRPGVGRNVSGCPAGCARLGACLARGLRCDGRVDCPGGDDEAAGATCGAGARVLAVLAAPGAAGAALGVVAAALLLLLGVGLGRRRRARKSPKAARLSEGLLFDASRASSACS